MVGQSFRKLNSREHRASSDEDDSEDGIDRLQVAQVGAPTGTVPGHHGSNQSERLPSPSHTFNIAANTAENISPGSFAWRQERSFPRSGTSVAQPTLPRHHFSTDIHEDRPHMRQPATAPNLGNNLSRGSTPSVRQVESQHNPHLLAPAHLNQTPANNLNLRSYTTDSRQDESLDFDEEVEEYYALYRKRRRGADASTAISTAETRRLEEHCKLGLS